MVMPNFFSGMSGPPGDMSGNAGAEPFTPGFDYETIPSVDSLLQQLSGPNTDPEQPARPRPTTAVLLERKRRIQDFWYQRNLRMVDDEKMYKMLKPAENVVGQESIGASEVLILNDPYVLVEKISNMVAAQEATVETVLADPGMKDAGQKVTDFWYYWRDESNERWTQNLNNDLTRDEVYYLALRGWLSGRLMLDPADEEYPYRYDLIDPITVFPQRGPKGIRWLFHIYKDSKVNVLNDLGWDDDLVQRIEITLEGRSDADDVEVAAYYDDTYHVIFVNDTEVWSAAHNYGFMPWVINIAFGPPIRRVDSSIAGGTSTNPNSPSLSSDSYVKWWGVSIFAGIKDVYQKLNKLASAIMTEAMKAPNPPTVIYTNNSGQIEGKQLDTSIGATNTLVYGQEDYKVVQYGFNPSELAPLMELLQGARDRGALPSVMYGQGANYLSGFAVSLLQSGSRDVVLPIIKSHQNYLTTLYKRVLRLTAEIYQQPINMIGTDMQTGARTQLTSITPEEILSVGYRVKVRYQDIFPKDKERAAMMAAALVRDKVISLDTARGEEFLGLKNVNLENKKVLHDLAYFDQDTVKAAIPSALAEVDPWLYYIYEMAQQRKQQEQMMMMQMQIMMQGRQGSAPGEKPGRRPEQPPGPNSPQPASEPPRPQQARQIGEPPY